LIPAGAQRRPQRTGTNPARPAAGPNAQAGTNSAQGGHRRRSRKPAAPPPHPGAQSPGAGQLHHERDRPTVDLRISDPRCPRSGRAAPASRRAPGPAPRPGPKGPGRGVPLLSR
jgi:hypothetical protein